MDQSALNLLDQNNYLCCSWICNLDRAHALWALELSGCKAPVMQGLGDWDCLKSHPLTHLGVDAGSWPGRPLGLLAKMSTHGLYPVISWLLHRVITGCEEPLAKRQVVGAASFLILETETGTMSCMLHSRCYRAKGRTTAPISQSGNFKTIFF